MDFDIFKAENSEHHLRVEIIIFILKHDDTGKCMVFKWNEK